ncbi:Sphingosine kinase 1 [Rhynchospora pubera]|uniref:sphingosine kinase n=1 Tax=Rhynchospora pubera TaxID=906938 RepID=A0AAV8FF25_9POAL|nr:Sphingosine kinase 1 [Rhynchospora pubera]
MEAQSKKDMRRTTGVQSQTETVSINNSLTKASLTLSTESGRRGGELRWHISNDGKSKGERSLDFDRDVLGVEVKDKRIKLKAFEVLQKESLFFGKGEKERVRKDYVFEMETEEKATLWGRTISECIESLGRPKELFVIVNPFGGKRCGPKIFEKEVKPLLEAAGINFKMQETRYGMHAKEIAYSLDLSKYDGIACVSGDGVVVEVVNGLLKREDWKQAITMPLGIIPGGTGNGMAKSLLHSVREEYSASNATFAIVRGCKCPLDVASVVQGDKSLLRIFGLRKYDGKIQFVPALGYEEFGEPIGESNKWKGETVILQDAFGNSGGSEMHGYKGSSTEFEESKWRFINGPFVTVWIQNVPWASKDIMPAPQAKFSDGCLDLVIVKDCPKTVLLSLLLSIRDGSHVYSPFVTYLKVKALKLEPGQRVGDPTMGGIVDMDGELIARGDDAIHHDPNWMDYGTPFLMKVDEGLATLFCPN